LQVAFMAPAISGWLEKQNRSAVSVSVGGWAPWGVMWHL
jgi:hypothetical protein